MHSLGAGSGSSLQCLCISPDSALSTVHRSQKRLAGTCPLSPKKLGHSTYMPHYFTWISNFFISDPQLHHICRAEVYLPGNSKTIILKTPSNYPTLMSLWQFGCWSHPWPLSSPLCSVMHSPGTGNPPRVCVLLSW